MKKCIVIVIGALLLAVTAVFFGTWIYLKSQAQPLYGNFDVGMKCMGGHEIFLDLEFSHAYQNCPGHRDRKLIGRIVRTKDSATIIDLRDSTPWLRIEWNGTTHSVSVIEKPDSQSTIGMISASQTTNQVNNPWRLWLPRLLPEN